METEIALIKQIGSRLKRIKYAPVQKLWTVQLHKEIPDDKKPEYISIRRVKLDKALKDAILFNKIK